MPQTKYTVIVFPKCAKYNNVTDLDKLKTWCEKNIGDGYRYINVYDGKTKQYLKREYR